MIIISFLSILSTSIYANLSISNFKSTKSPIFLSKSPFLCTPNFYSSKSTFTSLYLSKFLISNSFCSILYLSNSNYNKILIHHSNISNFLSQAFYINSDECNHPREYKQGGAESLSFVSDCFSNLRSPESETTVFKKSGGACNFYGISKIDFQNCQFINCSCTYLGGAVFMSNIETCTFNTCHFSKCHILGGERDVNSTYGSAIAIDRLDSLTAQYLKLEQNYIDDSNNGCSIYLKNVKSSQIISSTFSNNCSCKYDIGYNLESKSTALVTRCCFNKYVVPISNDLNKKYEFTLDFTNNSIYGNFDKVYSFASSDNHHFITSNAFVNSFCIFATLYFTDSNSFTRSSVFTSSSPFSYSSLFSSSSIFTKTSLFSSTSTFTSSIIFSSSHDFSVSSDFSDSFFFTSSTQFSTSKFFSGSLIFSNTMQFSSTSDFSVSGYFSQSSDFSQSETHISAISSESLSDDTSEGTFSKSLSFSCSETGELFFYERGTKLSKGGIAGIVIACLALLAIIIALIILFLHRKKSAFIPPEDDPMNIDGLEIPVNMYD